MASLQDPIDSFIQPRRHFFAAAGQHRGPGCVQQDIADSRFTMKQDWNAALQGFYGRDAITLAGGHQKQVSLAIEILEFFIAHKSAKENAAAQSEVGGLRLESFDLRAGACDVETPVYAAGKRKRGTLEFGERVKHPVDALAALDAGNAEHAKDAMRGPDFKRGGGAQSAHSDDFCFHTEDAPAFILKVFTIDDCASAEAGGSAQAVADDPV